MKITILDRKVRHNLALLKHFIIKEAEHRAKFFRTAKKTFHCYVNRHTGEFLLEAQQVPPASEWKAVTIQLRPDEGGAFEILEYGSSDCFHCQELQAEAYAVLAKTLHILNQLVFDPVQGQNPFWVMRQVSKLDFMLTEQEEGRRNLILEAWYNADRVYAEYLLNRMPVGTYLFRKDEFASELEENLNEALFAPVTCVTLTYNDWDGKICDKTLVFYKEKWLFYNNDPELSSPSFETVQELLSSLGDALRRPLLAG